MSEVVTYNREGSIGVITVNYPPVNALTAGFFTSTGSNTKRFNIAGQHRQLVSNGFPQLFPGNQIGRRRTSQRHNGAVLQMNGHTRRVDVAIPLAERQTEAIRLVVLHRAFEALLLLRPGIAIFGFHGVRDDLAAFI